MLVLELMVVGSDFRQHGDQAVRDKWSCRRGVAHLVHLDYEVIPLVQQ